jgi:hypothetical protein
LVEGEAGRIDGGGAEGGSEEKSECRAVQEHGRDAHATIPFTGLHGGL